MEIELHKKTNKLLLDMLFPIKCLSCDCEGAWICEQCLEKIPGRKNQVCPLCEIKNTPDGHICFSCRKKSALDGMLVASSYRNTLIASAVHSFKYRFAENIHKSLGKILVRAYLNTNIPLPDAIIPVPLHPRRLRWRGFNQTKLLADYLSANLTPGFPVPVMNDSLVRKKFTAPQMQIKNYKKRKINIQNAFIFHSNETLRRNHEKNEHTWIKNKRILLLDDIATTGATLFECAKVLKSAGAREVLALVIARQELK